jgi:hypothetical protein
MSMLRSYETRKRSEMYYTIRAIIRFAFWFACGYITLVAFILAVS